jgi:hypothetical protein
MKPIERGEILGLAEYEQVRERFRSRVIAQKRLRRVQLGPRATVLFENRDTVLLQIQEMLRTERITRPGAVQHELDTYNELVPAAGEVSCTLMVEIVDKTEREAFLVAAKGLERHVWLVAGPDRVAARSVDRGGTDERTTAVHYLRFALPPPVLDEIARGAATDGASAPLELVVDHPAYEARAVLAAATRAELAEDLRT